MLPQQMKCHLKGPKPREQPPQPTSTPCLSHSLLVVSLQKPRRTKVTAEKRQQQVLEKSKMMLKTIFYFFFCQSYLNDAKL